MAENTRIRSGVAAHAAVQRCRQATLRTASTLAQPQLSPIGPFTQFRLACYLLLISVLMPSLKLASSWLLHASNRGLASAPTREAQAVSGLIGDVPDDLGHRFGCQGGGQFIEQATDRLDGRCIVRMTYACFVRAASFRPLAQKLPRPPSALDTPVNLTSHRGKTANQNQLNERMTVAHRLFSLAFAAAGIPVFWKRNGTQESSIQGLDHGRLVGVICLAERPGVYHARDVERDTIPARLTI